MSNESMISKAELRKKLLTVREQLSPADIQKKSHFIKKRLQTLSQYRHAKTIMAYLDIKNEVQTREIIVNSLQNGKRILIPVCQPQEVNLIASELVHFPEDLAPGLWGILEPKPDCLRPVEAEMIDLVLVPGVGFDFSGQRLGYGAGYYDRFLVKLRPGTPKIALAYELQIVTHIEKDIYDVPVDYIITEDRTITAATKPND